MSFFCLFVHVSEWRSFFVRWFDFDFKHKGKKWMYMKIKNKQHDWRNKRRSKDCTCISPLNIFRSWLFLWMERWFLISRYVYMCICSLPVRLVETTMETQKVNIRAADIEFWVFYQTFKPIANHNRAIWHFLFKFLQLSLCAELLGMFFVGWIVLDSF